MSYQDPYSQMYGYSPYERRRRFRSGGSCLGAVITLIVLAFVAFILTLTIPVVDVLHLFHPHLTGAGEHMTLTVSSHPTLVIDSQTSSSSTFENQDKAPIHIQAGASDQKITLSAANIDTDPNDGDANDVILYNQTQDGSVTTLQVRSGYTGSITITVPRQTDLKISTLASSVEVVGVTGQMVLQSNSGPLTVKESLLSAASVLNNNSGPIRVEQSTLDGSVMLNNNSGSLVFSGHVNAQGNYHLLNNTGNIDVTFSSTDTFHLDAVTNSGSIVEEIPGIKGTDKEVHGDIGKTGSTKLSLYNNSGAIKIQKA